mgnify:CR=1 FL=1
MGEPLLTIVLAIRNRGGARLANCLRSLRWQEGFEASEIEVLLSDFGSEPKARAEIAKLADEHDARVHFTETMSVWNRSRALNIGLKRARGRFSLCSDVDMIYAPDFLRAVMDAQREHEERALVLCQALDLGPETRERVVTRDQVEALRDEAIARPLSGLGGCQCARTDWFRRVRGYDEVYRYWGAEDKDLTQRAEECTLNVCSGRSPSLTLFGDLALLHRRGAQESAFKCGEDDADLPTLDSRLDEETIGRPGITQILYRLLHIAPVASPASLVGGSFHPHVPVVPTAEPVYRPLPLADRDRRRRPDRKAFRSFEVGLRNLRQCGRRGNQCPCGAAF